MISGLRVEYSKTGEDGAAALERLTVAFERAGEELKQFGTYVFPRMVPVFEQEMESQFSAEGHGPSGSWAPLSEQYAAWKEQHYPGKPILQREGHLHEALTSSSSPFARRTIGGESFDFGTVGLEYASTKQLGTAREPARPPFDFGSDFERIITATAMDGAREALAVAGADEFLTEAGA